MTERWLPVVDYEGFYEVSDQGRVRSIKRIMEVTGPNGAIQLRRRRGMMLKPAISAGKLCVVLCHKGQKTRLVHHLVLEAFIGPRPQGMEACHHNDIPTDNRLENLRWDTRRANVLDAVRNGKHHWARRTHCKNGHEYNDENTHIGSRGGRECRACDKARYRRKKTAKCPS